MFNHYKMSFDSHANIANVHELIQSMQADPQLAKQVYSLYAGPNYSRNEAIDESIIDVARINYIQKFNSFGSTDLHELLITSNKDNNSGLWIYPAYINHSCVHNCENVFIGDTMFVYAKRDIDEGEELFHRYFNEAFVSERQRITKTGKTWLGIFSRFEINTRFCS